MDTILAQADRGRPAPTRTFRVLSAILGAMLGVFYSVMLWYAFGATGDYAPLMLFFLPLVMLALFCVNRCLQNAAPARWVKYGAMAFGAVFLLGAQVRFAISIYGHVNYDFGIVYAAAADLSTTGGLGGWESYFANFPNNVLLVLVFTAVMKLCAFFGITNIMAVLTAGSMAAVDLTVLLICLCARKLWGDRAAWVTLFFAIPFCVLHYGIVSPYSDTFSMPFIAALLTFYIYMPRRERPALACCAIMGLLAPVGYKVKPQAIIIVIAIALVEAFFLRPDKGRLLHLGKRALAFSLAAVVSFWGFGALSTAATGHLITPQMREELEVPFTHYLMMGTNPESGGKWHGEDYDNTIALPSQREKVAFNLRVTGRRLAAMGLIGYGKFLVNKGRTIFASAYMNMWVGPPFSCGDPLSTAIQDTFCQGGSGFTVYLQFLQAVWIVLLLLLVLPLVFCPQTYRDKAGTVLRLELMGFTLFQLLFEAGARYRFHQLPIFILLGAWGVMVLPQGLRQAWGRLKSRPNRKDAQK